MDGESFSLRWEDERTPETIIPDMDQTAAENLMYLSQDVVSYTDPGVLDDAGVECVTEEVITDDWVVPGGQERVEVPLEQLTQPLLDLKEDNDIDVPLPTDQDEYTAMRPWPCDFCSRRFRKKAALMNHMVAHQSDRPHACNLCGVRYVRKTDLMNHLKNHTLPKAKKKRGRRKKIPEPVKEEENEELWENMTSARTQQWSRKRPPAPLPPSPPSPATPPRAPSPAPPADPTRPFVCNHCGIGFAREKALQSHSRVHGGDSPIECSACGELCWSREALHSHMRRRHPAMSPRPRARAEPAASEESDDSGDAEYRLSPAAEARVQSDARGPELFCQHCGVAFQRADLLRRHVHAAHSYRRHDSEATDEHTCDVCGDTCSDALSLLAHAETHAAPAAQHRIKSRNKSRNTTSNNGRQFPCRECGKVFGSRSSQQIHVRIHTGERPYACRFCWKAFADGGTLRKHERIHTGEKPYACAVCPRAFNQRVVLREHVRSHHSAPDRRAPGGPSYVCVVCGRALAGSAELVQHLIQHCDANTALKRQPQSGPRKYKRRRKMKDAVKRSVSSSPSPSPPPPAPRARRRRASPPPRPRMIHTAAEDVRPRTKQVRVRNRRPPRHPADDLRAIRPHLTPPSPVASPAASPAASPVASPSPEPVRTKQEPEEVEEMDTGEGGGFRCEMCARSFPRRDELLLHVPVHI